MDTIQDTEVNGMEVSEYLNENTLLPQSEKLPAITIRTGTEKYRSYSAVRKQELCGKSSETTDSILYALHHSACVHYNRGEETPPGAGTGFSCLSGIASAASAASENMPDSTWGGGGAVR